ncbi:hypothetical protein D3C76_1601920 [compost metagenome]
MTNRFLFYTADKLAHNGQCHIGFEQRHADFAQRFFHIVFGKAPTAADVAQRARQTIG